VLFAERKGGVCSIFRRALIEIRYEKKNSSHLKNKKNERARVLCYF